MAYEVDLFFDCVEHGHFQLWQGYFEGQAWKPSARANIQQGLYPGEQASRGERVEEVFDNYVFSIDYRGKVDLLVPGLKLVEVFKEGSKLGVVKAESELKGAFSKNFAKFRVCYGFWHCFFVFFDVFTPFFYKKRGFGGRFQLKAYLYAPVFLRWTMSIEMAAGVTPEILLAWPIDAGLTLSSFSRISVERPCTSLKFIAGMRISSIFLKRCTSSSCLLM
mgnify:CR=1 FL=1